MKKLFPRLILSVLLVLSLLSSSLLAGLSADASASVWNGVIPAANANATYSGGDGTEANPYHIATAADLAQLSASRIYTCVTGHGLSAAVFANDTETLKFASRINRILDYN
jgi:hypothetical protein